MAVFTYIMLIINSALFLFSLFALWASIEAKAKIGTTVLSIATIWNLFSAVYDFLMVSYGF